MLWYMSYINTNMGADVKSSGDEVTSEDSEGNEQALTNEFR